LAAFVLAACGASDSSDSSDGNGEPPPSPTTTTSASSTESASPSPTPVPSVRTIEVSVAGSTVTPPPARVDATPNEPLRLVVTSDRAGVLHAHGTQPELAIPVTAGQSTTADFLAPAQPGLYEIELHDPNLLLFQLAVQ
jgi:hypothetical protein